MKKEVTMSNNKQSSVDDIMKFMKENGYFIGKDLYQFFEQAKAIHKQEIIQAWKKGDGQFDKVSDKMSLEYYNETYSDESNH